MFPQTLGDKVNIKQKFAMGKKNWTIWWWFLSNSHFLHLEGNLKEVVDEYIGEMKASTFTITKQGAVCPKNK